jgi:hypothetical protein
MRGLTAACIRWPCAPAVGQRPARSRRWPQRPSRAAIRALGPSLPPDHEYVRKPSLSSPNSGGASAGTASLGSCCTRCRSRSTSVLLATFRSTSSPALNGEVAASRSCSRDSPAARRYIAPAAATPTANAVRAISASVSPARAARARTASHRPPNATRQIVRTRPRAPGPSASARVRMVHTVASRPCSRKPGLANLVNEAIARPGSTAVLRLTVSLGPGPRFQVSKRSTVGVTPGAHKATTASTRG